MRSDQDRLRDILEAIERIEERAPRSRSELENDELLQVWVLHHLRILAEAVRALSPDFRDAHPDVPWRGIIGMRNILVHHYFDIDTSIVWSVLESDLDKLKARILAIVQEGQEEGQSA